MSLLSLGSLYRMSSASTTKYMHTCLLRETIPTASPVTPIPFSTQWRSFLTPRQTLSKGVGHAASAKMASQRFCKLTCRVCSPPTPSLISPVLSRCTDKNVVSTVDRERRERAAYKNDTGWCLCSQLCHQNGTSSRLISRPAPLYPIGLGKLAYSRSSASKWVCAWFRFRAVDCHLHWGFLPAECGTLAFFCINSPGISCGDHVCLTMLESVSLEYFVSPPQP